MPRILYNEGRVVGYSAYEEYVRQALQQDPDSTPATEKEWLASTISIGSSMLLHIQPDAENSLTRDFKLPETSRLFAANTIIGSFFEGVGHNSADSPWCDYVESYGNLITNTSASHPTTDATTYPSTEDSDEYKQRVDNQIKQYLKIKDGVVIKEGTWETSTKTLPAEVLTSTNNNPPIVRLSFESKIDTDFYILLSGFTDKAVIKGVTNIENQTETQSPQNGDFLGPAVFPWANKIIFTLSSRQDEIIKSNTLRDIKAGIGIDIDKNDDGSITINNSAPNWSSAKYTRIQDANTNTHGYFYTYVFNNWKSPFHELINTNEVTSKPIFSNFKKNTHTIPLNLNTAYSQDGELIGFSIMLANNFEFSPVVDIFQTTVNGETSDYIDDPITIVNVGGKLMNRMLVNLSPASPNTNKYGIGMHFLHSDYIYSQTDRGGKPHTDSLNNRYYPYQSVLFAIKFKNSLDYDTEETKEAIRIHDILAYYASSGSNQWIETKEDGTTVDIYGNPTSIKQQKYAFSSDFSSSNIINIKAGNVTNDVWGKVQKTGNKITNNDPANVGSPLGYIKTTVEAYSGKNYGCSFSISYGAMIVTEKMIASARLSVNQNEKENDFYHRIICAGSNKEILAPGDILIVAYSINDGYNDQLYIDHWAELYNKVSPLKNVFNLSNNLQGTISFQKL